MPNLNKVFLMGNLTRNPELRYTPNGIALATFGLATNRRWSDKAGEKKEEVCFVELTAFAKTAETIANYCKRGSPLFVEGRLQFQQWEGKDGNKHHKLSVVVENFQFIGSGEKIKPVNDLPAQAGTKLPPGEPDVKEEDLPF